MTNLLRIDFIVSGKVQGVGYRYFVKSKATSLGINGYVRNEKDGSVFVVAQGKIDELDILLDYCYKGPPSAIVRHIHKIKKPLGNFEKFRVDS